MKVQAKDRTRVILFIILVGIMASPVILATAKEPDPPSKQICPEGTTKIVGKCKYQCADNQWLLSQPCVPDEVPPTPVCSEGQTKTVGFYTYQCADNQWLLQKPWTDVIPNPIPAPLCSKGATTCVGTTQYGCLNNREWVLVEEKSTACGYTPPASQIPIQTKILIVEKEPYPIRDCGAVVEKEEQITFNTPKKITITNGESSGTLLYAITEPAPDGISFSYHSFGATHPWGTLFLETGTNQYTIPLPITSPITFDDVTKLRLKVIGNTPLAQGTGMKTLSNGIIRAIVTWIEY